MDVLGLDMRGGGRRSSMFCRLLSTVSQEALESTRADSPFVTCKGIEAYNVKITFLFTGLVVFSGGLLELSCGLAGM